MAGVYQGSLSERCSDDASGFQSGDCLGRCGAVVGEFVGGRSGLGYFMMLATGNFDTPLVFACVIVLTLLGVALFYAIAACERLLGRWNRVAFNAEDETQQAWTM